MKINFCNTMKKLYTEAFMTYFAFELRFFDCDLYFPILLKLDCKIHCL